MIITPTAKVDGSVELRIDSVADYEIYRSVDSVNFTKINEIVNGKYYHDLRPNTNWKRISAESAIYDGTWSTRINSKYYGGSAKYTAELLASATYTFTGKAIGLVASKKSNAAVDDGGRFKIAANVYVDNVLEDKIDLGIYSPNVDWNTMCVWAKEFDTIVTKSIKVELQNLNYNDLTIEGFWVDTGEQNLTFGQTGYYKVVNKTTLEEQVVEVTPSINYKESQKALFKRMLDFQATFPNKQIPSIDVNKVRHSSAYPLWVACDFGTAYYLTGDKNYYDAMVRQFDYSLTMKNSEGLIVFVDEQGNSLTHADYNGRQSAMAYWLYHIFREGRFLREAESALGAMVAKWGTGVWSWDSITYSPVVFDGDVANVQSIIGLSFAQLWAEPNSKFYQDSTIKKYAENHLKAGIHWAKKLGTGELPYTSVYLQPSGVYSAFQLATLNLANKFFRNSDGTPIVLDLQSVIDNAEPWEMKYAVEPWANYRSRYPDHVPMVVQTKRAMFAYHESLKGKITLDKWQNYYQMIFTPAWYQYPYADPRGVEDYATTMRQNKWDGLRGMMMNVVCGIPEEWWIIDYQSWKSKPIKGYKKVKTPLTAESLLIYPLEYITNNKVRVHLDGEICCYNLVDPNHSDASSKKVFIDGEIKAYEKL